jgi:uncharacterized damage-inducible protein DinB
MLRTIALLAAIAVPMQSVAINVKTRPAPKRGFRAEFLHDLDDVQKKILDLAAAVPADKYAWRPAPGVRSISEVYMHIAGGNHVLASFVGGKPGYDTRSLESITDKPRVLEELKKSFDNIRAAALNASDADLDKTVKIFGNNVTERAAFINALNHLHEHLGQSIAYARINGVVPPWTGNQ